MGSATRSLRRVFPLELHHTSSLSHNRFCLLKAYFSRTSCWYYPRAKGQGIGNHCCPMTHGWSSTIETVDGFSGGHKLGNCTYNLLHILHYLNSIQWQAFWKRVAAWPCREHVVTAKKPTRGSNSVVLITEERKTLRSIRNDERSEDRLCIRCGGGAAV
jgi:hypothetical protein